MKKRLSFAMIILSMTALLGACGAKSSIEDTSDKPIPASSSSKPSTSQGPKKTVSDLSISLGNSGDKAYITVTGKQENYTADEFKWAWGLMDRDTSEFADGKANPSGDDFVTGYFEAGYDYCGSGVPQSADDRAARGGQDYGSKETSRYPASNEQRGVPGSIKDLQCGRTS